MRKAETVPPAKSVTTAAGNDSAAADRRDPIAAGLRRLWADVEQEPVPDDFLDLLDSIDEARAANRDTGGAGA